MSLATPAVTPEVSILAPANDEADNLPEFVRQAREALLPLPYAGELIVVNDGSKDNTEAIARGSDSASRSTRRPRRRSNSSRGPRR